MYTFTHDGVTITVQPAEQGRHTVVFLNGLFGGGWMWEPVVATLTAAGYGTVVTTEPLAAHETAQDIPALLQSISLLIDTLPDSSPILCGNSMGAFVAMELAAAEPSRWAGVILSGAPGLGDEQPANTVGSSLRDPSQKLGDRIADKMIHDKDLITPELVERCTEALSPRILLRAGRALRATRGYDARPLLGRIDIPVLLAFGACDEVSSPAKWRAAASMFPDADYVEIAGAGHSPMLEKPEVFSDLVASWLDTVPAPQQLSERSR